MKRPIHVYSWKTLAATLVIAVPFFIYKLLHFGGLADLVWLAIFGYFILQGLSVSFNQQAHEADLQRAALGKRVRRELFGKFAPAAPYVPLLLLLLVWAVAVWLPSWKWLMILLLLSAAVYAVWFVIVCQKHLQRVLESQTKK